MEPRHSPSAEERRQKRRVLILLVVAGILFILTWILGYSVYQHKKELDATKAALAEAQRLNAQLESELAEFETEVAKYKGEIASLDSVIAQQHEALAARAEEIRGLIQKGKVTQAQLRKARQELERLRYLVNDYKYRLDSLYEENKRLQAENQQLKTEVRQYKQEREHLKDENVKLKIKLAVGSRLATSNIEVKAFRIRRGKERETTRAKRAERLRVCFQLVDNPVADYGDYPIYVRLITPAGETIYVEDAGSGSTTLDGKNTLYSFKGTISFKNEPQRQYCLEWALPVQLSSGIYKIQLLTKDYVVGETTIKLR